MRGRKYTYEECKQAALRYSSRYAFDKGNHREYAWIICHKWYELLDHMPKRIDVKWTLEKCKEIASKYESPADLHKASPQCYQAICKHHYQDECYAHMDKSHTMMYRGIYAFEFHDNHVYVGLTHNFKKRKRQHIEKEGKKLTAVAKYIIKTDLTPTFKIVLDYMPLEVARVKEGEVLSKYIEDGWIPLNTKKTGGYGGVLYYNYDFDEAVELAKQYTSRHTFANAHRNLYAYFVYHKRIAELFEKAGIKDGRHPVKWTIEAIYENVKQYSSYSEWCKNEKNKSYQAARKYGIREKIMKEMFNKQGLRKKVSQND